MKRSILTLATLISVCPLVINAQEGATLEDVLFELRVLRNRVETLETKLSDLEARNEVTQQAVASSVGSQKEDKKFFEKFRNDVQRANRMADGAWISSSNWQRIQKKMKEEEVVAILGEPSREKFSVRKDTDLIYIYEGDLDGRGAVVKGEIRFYKGKVTRFIAPDLP